MLCRYPHFSILCTFHITYPTEKITSYNAEQNQTCSIFLRKRLERSKPRFAKGDLHDLSWFPVYRTPTAPFAVTSRSHKLSLFPLQTKTEHFPSFSFYVANEKPNSLEVPFAHWCRVRAVCSPLAWHSRLSRVHSCPKALQRWSFSLKDTCSDVAKPSGIWQKQLKF